MSRDRYYGIRFVAHGSYSVTGRPCLVRTFATESDRAAWLAEERPVGSVLHDGRREAVAPWTLVTDRRSRKAEPVTEALPGL